MCEKNVSVAKRLFDTLNPGIVYAKDSTPREGRSPSMTLLRSTRFRGPHSIFQHDRTALHPNPKCIGGVLAAGTGQYSAVTNAAPSWRRWHRFLRTSEASCDARVMLEAEDDVTARGEWGQGRDRQPCATGELQCHLPTPAFCGTFCYYGCLANGSKRVFCG